METTTKTTERRTAAERLAAAARLAERVAVYIPGTVGTATEDSATAARMVERCAALMSRAFGGATATAARGYWLSAAEGLVAEQTTVVYAYADAESIEQHLGDVLDFVDDMKAEMKQEAVSVEYGGALFIL